MSEWPRLPDGRVGLKAARWRLLASAVLFAFGMAATAAVSAQPATAAKARLVADSDADTRWQQLSAEQRSALAPLEHDWNGLPAPTRQKWLQVAQRYPRMSETERSRLQGRMTQWVRMSPQERGAARLHYEQAQGVTPQERQAKWEAYQALSPEQRQKLAKGPAATANEPRKAAAEARAGREASTGKSNIVGNAASSAAPKSVAPGMVQARPGATTRLSGRPTSPPSHQQTGLPKIAVSPGFVDKSTLLPQRGAQGAATHSARTEPRNESKHR